MNRESNAYAALIDHHRRRVIRNFLIDFAAGVLTALCLLAVLAVILGLVRS